MQLSTDKISSTVDFVYIKVTNSDKIQGFFLHNNRVEKILLAQNDERGNEAPKAFAARLGGEFFALAKITHNPGRDLRLITSIIKVAKPAECPPALREWGERKQFSIEELKALPGVLNVSLTPEKTALVGIITSPKGEKIQVFKWDPIYGRGSLSLDVLFRMMVGTGTRYSLSEYKSWDEKRLGTVKAVCETICTELFGKLVFNFDRLKTQPFVASQTVKETQQPVAKIEKAEPVQLELDLGSNSESPTIEIDLDFESGEEGFDFGDVGVEAKVVPLSRNQIKRQQNKAPKKGKKGKKK